MSNQKRYSTLSKSRQVGQIYHDRDSLPYSASYPIVEFSSDTITIRESPKKLEKYLLDNFWYQKSNSEKRKQILHRVIVANQHIDIVLDFFEKSYGHLDKKCLHISIAGSYIYSDSPGDIDLNVIVDGSFFDYTTFNDGVSILDVTGTVSKISLTIMGLDNILGTKKTVDSIENKGFLHQDTILREMIVAPMRNVTVFGNPLDKIKIIDSKNVLVRIARQLYFSTLTLEGKIPYYKDEPLRTKKALSRIKEAHDIIEWLLNLT